MSFWPVPETPGNELLRRNYHDDCQFVECSETDMMMMIVSL